MQLLILQFVSPRQTDPLPVFSHDLGVLAASLEAERIECSLATLPGYSPGRLREAVIRHRPRCVLAELTPHSVTAARRTIAEIKSAYGLAVAVCGPYATCRPGRAVSIPGVDARLVGEYDRSGVELLRAWRDRREGEGLEGVWAATDSGLVRGRLSPLTEDLDSLPTPDRDLFDTRRIVDETRELCFKVARGCPLWCAQCFNDWYMDLYEGKGAFVRRRSVTKLLDEVASVTDRYPGAETVTFYDHCFTMDEEWLAAFAAEYPRRCRLPYRCHVRLSSVTPRVASLLAESNCRWVHTHLGSGSRFIREEIFSMPLSNDRIRSACRTLHDAGLQIAAELFLGCPYESEITVEETVDLVRGCEPDEVYPRVFYPTPGTRAAELCAENGWISGRGEENYWLGRSVLNMPSMSADEIAILIDRFGALRKKGARSGLRKLIGKIRRSRRTNIRDLQGGH